MFALTPLSLVIACISVRKRSVLMANVCHVNRHHCKLFHALCDAHGLSQVWIGWSNVSLPLWVPPTACTGLEDHKCVE